MSTVEDTQDKMNRLLKEKDLDIRSLLDKQKSEIANYETIQVEMRKEIECHKQNIIASNDLLSLIYSQ